MRFGILVVVLALATVVAAQTPATRPSGGSGVKPVPPGDLIDSMLSTPATKPATRPVSSGVQAVPPSQLIDNLLKAPAESGRPLQPIREAPVIDATTGRAAVAPAAPQINLVREGTYVVDRKGRLTRSPDGLTAEFSFEADGKALKDPPMVLLPNLKLMQMENAVQSSSRDLRFRITGMVTEYKGRNYLLLEKVVVVPDAAQQF